MADAGATETVSAYARIRTPNNEKSTPDIEVVAGAPERVRIGHAETPDKKIEFSLDNNFEGDASQADVFEAVGKPLVARVLDGFNATIMAYGQTGSGKTFTMLGPEEVKTDLESNKELLGIVPRACEQLFAGLPAGCSVTLSYIEVYNNGVNDLLSPDSGKATDYLKLREITPGHVEPEGLTKVPVTSTKAVLDAIVVGDGKRVIAPMAMNPRSSRGHGLMTLQVTAEDGSGGRLMMVDLAGMESSKKSAPEGASNLEKRKQEAKAINVSLLALRNVLGALASKSPRVGWRESKLTRLLQSSLGANCKAAIVVTVRSEKKNIEESIGTLKFAQNAKSVEATVVKVSAKPTGGDTAKLQAELDAALAELKRRARELNDAKEYRAGAMMEIMSLQGDVKRLKAEAEARDSVAVASKKELPPETARYVQSLERKVKDLEEENRVLRERDIKYRMMGLDGGGGGDKGGAGKLPAFAPAPMMVFEGNGFAQTKMGRSGSVVEVGGGRYQAEVIDDIRGQRRPRWSGLRPRCARWASSSGAGASRPRWSSTSPASTATSSARPRPRSGSSRWAEGTSCAGSTRTTITTT